MKRVSILGATGSIGKQALEVIRESKGELSLVSFSYHSSVELAGRIEAEFSVDSIRLGDSYDDNSAALLNMVKASEPDVLLVSSLGTVGLRATLYALERGIPCCIANKETLVAAGDLLLPKYRDLIIPVDSEHSAIYQCLGCRLDHPELESIVLTASGGPFRGKTKDEIAHKKASDAIKHPNWSMGRKISVDSATLMNKGLELIEAMHLFGLRAHNIEILVHPESIVHSMVRFSDGSVLAQMGEPSMIQPIALALHGKRIHKSYQLDFTKHPELHFLQPDLSAFPCLGLAMDVAKEGGILPAVMNAANEVLVDAYLKDAIGFYDIYQIAVNIVEQTKNTSVYSVEQIEAAIKDAVERTKQQL